MTDPTWFDQTWNLAINMISCLLMLAGAGFSFIAALGIFRMPDLFTRMQAAAKTGTLGVGLVLMALAFHFADVGVATRAGLVILFLFLTAPIAAHLIARAGYISGATLWHHSVCDELKGRYNMKTHELSSHHGDDANAPLAPDGDE